MWAAASSSLFPAKPDERQIRGLLRREGFAGVRKWVDEKRTFWSVAETILLGPKAKLRLRAKADRVMRRSKTAK
jgi:hypothetical protein